METLKTVIINSMKDAGAKHVADTTCWNYRAFKHESKNSNLAKVLNSLVKNADENLIIVIGKKGRSQHSKTDLHIFKCKKSVLIFSHDVAYRDFWTIY